MKRLVFIAGALAMLASCGGGSPFVASSPTPTQAPRPATTGDVTIVSPMNGQTVKGPDVTVRVRLTGATIADRAETVVKPDTGHMHISLDGKVQTLYAGESFTVKNVSSGQHSIQAEFVAADHGFFNPREFEQVFFTVTVG